MPSAVARSTAAAAGPAATTAAARCALRCATRAAPAFVARRRARAHNRRVDADRLGARHAAALVPPARRLTRVAGTSGKRLPVALAPGPHSRGCRLAARGLPKLPPTGTPVRRGAARLVGAPPSAGTWRGCRSCANRPIPHSHPRPALRCGAGPEAPLHHLLHAPALLLERDSLDCGRLPP
jgi:hypothetical protein